MKTKLLNVRVDLDLLNQIDNICAELRVSRNTYVRYKLGLAIKEDLKNKKEGAK